ncbi:MAG: hypothetical protein J3K34DRAFT_252992 [Monoraphidium minutum]|nr:MAG: hypothetical protein J3K34DRAFT_252992 [Monoraphidium minutum]
MPCGVRCPRARPPPQRRGGKRSGMQPLPARPGGKSSDPHRKEGVDNAIKLTPRQSGPRMLGAAATLLLRCARVRVGGAGEGARAPPNAMQGWAGPLAGVGPPALPCCMGACRLPPCNARRRRRRRESPGAGDAGGSAGGGRAEPPSQAGRAWRGAPPVLCCRPPQPPPAAAAAQLCGEGGGGGGARPPGNAPNWSESTARGAHGPGPQEVNA